MTNLTSKLKRHIGAEGWDWLQQIGRIATELDLPLYLVGGIVRDVLLGRSSPDLDLVIEGDAVALAQAVHSRYGGDLTSHAQFGTANWRPSLASGLDIDFVTARTESYRHPAALPDVTPATIVEDLQRRDFTINALAVRLDGDYLGRLLDPHRGMADLEAGIVRILHEQSFIDDPTRIWRAIRFEQRLGFTLDHQTETLLREGHPYLSRLSAARVRHELELVLQEDDPTLPLARLDEFAVLTAVFPHWHWNEESLRAWEQAERNYDTELGKLAQAEMTQAELRFLFWLVHCEGTADAIETQLNLSRQAVNRYVQAAALQNALKKGVSWTADTKPSHVAQMLAPTGREAAVGFTAVAHLDPKSVVYQLVSRYYVKWCHVAPYSTGHTLRQMGVPPGPVYREILWGLTAAWLDGTVQSEEEEIALLQTLLP